VTCDVELRVIGVARTPWTRREDAPHQPSAAPEAEGVVELAPEYAPGLADLGGFSRVWLISLLDRSHGFAAKVKPPRGGPKRGVFATRAPNRPSQLGLTCVELREVDVARGRLVVRGIDLLDRTPILDVKPYLPLVDAFPDAGHGWLEPYLAAGVEPRLRKPVRPPRR
jgi:tRNA-Thr(GGU) m(6)t(6)A37 methyltransferase TsaA